MFLSIYSSSIPPPGVMYRSLSGCLRSNRVPPAILVMVSSVLSKLVT